MTVIELTRPQIDAFLMQHRIGRIAFSFRDRVDIEPIHYAYEDGCLYGRTQPGTKLTTLQRNPWVAFEVDEVKSDREWTSVVLKGTVYLVADEASADVEQTYERVMARLQGVSPSLEVGDRRFVAFRIFVDDARGLRSVP
jgi:hypothetical protein